MGQGSSGPAGPRGDPGADEEDPALPLFCDASAAECVARPVTIAVAGRPVLRCDANGCAFPQGLRVVDGATGATVLLAGADAVEVAPRLSGHALPVVPAGAACAMHVHVPGTGGDCGVRLLRGVNLPSDAAAPGCLPANDGQWPTRMAFVPAGARR